MNRWTNDAANAWHAGQPWLVGCNFIPSTAVNQLEMWQADTFVAPAIARELGWAAGLGMNTARVFLHDLAWQSDPAGFLARLDRFLGLAAGRGIRPMLVLFDDCWNATPQAGPQPAPIPGAHNSGWLQSPGVAVVNDPSGWDRLERYVRGVVGAFGQDARVLAWDLYNEPGNSGQGERSLPLLRAAFEWARGAQPAQPLTAGVWTDLLAMNAFQIENSDVVTFHNYSGADDLAAQIADLRRHGRPLLCTEWLRRGHSEVAACLPVFHRGRVGCYNWGLVSGKTQTIYPWGAPPGGPEPAVWFHDLLRPDGAPFDAEEARLFRTLVAADNTPHL
jgi:hypothetical protein